MKRFLLSFVNQHSATFEALARSGTPFGGNWLTAKPKPATVQDQLAGIQQQLTALNGQVAELGSTIKATHGSMADASDEIGINRFRAMRARS